MSSAVVSLEVPSPFGALTISECDGAIVALAWEKPARSAQTDVLSRAGQQLAAYFAKELTEFDLPLNPAGDEFQQSVCDEMLKIPYGDTTTYGAIADALGTYGQPVGQACGGNTIPIIIPCHRVLAVNGLGGYSGEGGVERKIALLKLEEGFPYLL